MYTDLRSIFTRLVTGIALVVSCAVACTLVILTPAGQKLALKPGEYTKLVDNNFKNLT